MNKLTKRVFPPELIFTFLLFLVAVSCASGSGKGDKEVSAAPVPGIDSALARESFRCLEDYVSDKRPEILPLVMTDFKSSDKKGSAVEIVCSYEERGRSLWLKALLSRDSRGKQRVNKIIFAYEYDRRLQKP